VNPVDLAFDADAMLDGLRVWVECESPTYDVTAVNRMMDIASRDLVIAGARIERVAGRMGFGDCVRASFPHATSDVPGILVMGHLDTVHPVGTLARLPFRRNGSRAWVLASWT
jgi:glutamate carboxypeptidase